MFPCVTLMLSSIVFHIYSVHVHCLLFRTSLLKGPGSAEKHASLPRCGW